MHAINTFLLSLHLNNHASCTETHQLVGGWRKRSQAARFLEKKTQVKGSGVCHSSVWHLPVAIKFGTAMDSELHINFKEFRVDRLRGRFCWIQNFNVPQISSFRSITQCLSSFRLSSREQSVRWSVFFFLNGTKVR